MGFVQGERIHPDRILDFWVLGILVKGNLQLQVGNEHIALHSNSYYLLPPFVHLWGTKREVSEIIFFHWELKIDEQIARTTLPLLLVGKLPVEINYLIDI